MRSGFLFHIVAGACLMWGQPLPLVGQQVDFEREVVPLLEDRCCYCHGEEDQESNLRLDHRLGMLKGGDSGLAAVVPGKPEKSYLIEVVRHLDPGMEMPLDDEPLTEAEIVLLERWIRQGAIWPGQMDAVEQGETELWSFRPVQRPEVPENRTIHSHPVDAFLAEKLSETKLEFSVPADARTQLRRLSIVLTGLPPTPETTKEFIEKSAENSELAYSEMVETLLASPQFGERWAQHWLDVIRWAETNGSEANLYRKNAWIYRDYVIRSFNEDKPYDQFVREQIAGDTTGVGEALGFLVAGPHVPSATIGREPTAIRQARADRLNEVMQTIGASVMGVTVGCARCHNHKFDPITIRDYYAMTAAFEDIEFGSRHPEYSSDHPLQQRGSELVAELEARRDELKGFGGWEENWGAYRELHFRPIETQGVRIRFKAPSIFIDELEIFGPDEPQVNLALAKHGTKLTGYPEKGFETRNPVTRVNDGQYGTMVWRAKTEKDEEKPWVQFDLSDSKTISRLRISNNREYFYETDYLERKPNLPRYEFDLQILKSDGTWQPWVGTWAVNKKLAEQFPERQETLNEIQSLIGQLAEEGPRPSFVGRLVAPGDTYVLLRGSPENPRDKVAPAGPVMLGGKLDLPEDSTGPQRRLAIAQWLGNVEHPLTARVMVNRIWHHVFGQGLVSTTSDFGNAGALPTHPALLDWLAAEFMQPTEIQGQPWSTKSMLRLLVHSRAFRQSSQPNERGNRLDADSKWLWRFPPKRVEAEVIRDSILQASGNLDLRVGGRSYRIHNVKKTYAQWELVDNHGPETWRRMIYQERMRRVDDGMFTAFDFPDCGQVRAKRPVSTTPLQALNLMNSDFVMEQSRLIAERAQRESEGKSEQALARCFELLLGRKPTPREQESCSTLLRDGELNLICRAIINSNEFAFLP